MQVLRYPCNFFLFIPFADVTDKKKQNNRFIKQCFLKRLDKIIDLNSIIQGINQKNKFCKK
jgi:hypothetical protein